jgi:hypothetical protein
MVATQILSKLQRKFNLLILKICSSTIPISNRTSFLLLLTVITKMAHHTSNLAGFKFGEVRIIIYVKFPKNEPTNNENWTDCCVFLSCYTNIWYTYNNEPTQSVVSEGKMSHCSLVHDSDDDLHEMFGADVHTWNLSILLYLFFVDICNGA